MTSIYFFPSLSLVRVILRRRIVSITRLEAAMGEVEAYMALRDRLRMVPGRSICTQLGHVGIGIGRLWWANFRPTGRWIVIGWGWVRRLKRLRGLRWVVFVLFAIV